MSDGAQVQWDDEKPQSQQIQWDQTPKPSLVPSANEALSTPPTHPMPQIPAELRGKGTDLYPAMHPVNLATGSEQPNVLGEAVAPPVEGSIRAASAIPGIGRGLWNAAKVLGKGVAGASVGAATGGFGGRQIGSIFGNPELGGKIGATVGGLAGGILGGGAGSEESEVDPVAQAVKNRTAAWIPTRMPKPPAPEAEVDPVAQAVKSRIANWIPTRIKPPEEAPSPRIAITDAEQGASPTGQNIISRTGKLRISGESPNPEDIKSAGDMTQVPDDVLRVLSKNGDMQAKREYEQRRLKGSLGIIRKLVGNN